MPTPEDRPRPSTDHSPLAQDGAETPASATLPEGRSPAAGTLADPERLAQAVPGYEILEELGRGGMGVVYKARQTSLKRIVALKRIRSGTDAGPQDLARFRAEAESVARLQHPNIVQIYEVGEHQGLPFFSLEYVEGGSLDCRLAGVCPPALVVARLVEAVARGVHDAHQHGLVHRDLKPANVLLAGSPDVPLETCVPKVSDFGLVKRLDDNSAQTQSGAVIGTPAYMAPEQASGRNRDIGPPADIYALGAILYECLTGRPPFQADSPLETLAQVVQEEPVPPRKLNRKVPRDLETICLKCLHKVPARRYGSARDLADDLHRFLSFEPIRARRVRLAERGWRWLRRRPATALAGLLVLLLLAGAGIGYHLWRQAKESAGHDAGTAGLVVEYYESVLRPDDEPRGVGRLSEEEALRRPRAFKLYRRGNHIEQVEVLGQQGRLLRHNPFHLLAHAGAPLTALREASYHFVHDEEGRVPEVAAHDGAGRVLWTVQRLASGRVRYTERPGLEGKAPTEAALFELVRTEAGEVREVWLVDKEGRRTPARNKVHGLRRETGAAGEVRLTFLDGSGKPVGAVARWILRPPDAAGRLEEAYFDAAGTPVAGAEGCPRWVWSQEGPHGLRGAGRDAEGQPMRARDGSYSTLRHFDEQGREVEQAWFGPDGAPLVASSGSAKITRRYDAQGELLEKAYWTLGQRGNYVLRRRADAADHPLELAYFTPDGRPVLHANGYHRWTARYDQRGNLVEGTVFGLDDKPCLHRYGYHRWVARYDDHGYQVEWMGFGIDAAPCLCSQGHHRWTARYNDHGHQVEVAFFGLDDRPRALAQGVYRGFARLTSDYDSKGKLRQRGYWVPDGKGGCVLCRRADAADRTLERVYFTPAGRPALNREGIHRLVFRFDERGNRIEGAFFGLDGKPCLYRDGNHRWTARYDQRGRQVEWAYFGVDGRPVALRQGTNKGCARLTREYDATGKLRQLCHFVPDGKGGYILSFRADTVNHISEHAHFTPEGRPTLHRDGYHRLVTRYDERGQRVEEAYFGLDGKPCLCSNGMHRWVDRFDKRGNRVAGANFGTDGKPCLHKNGQHRWTARFDERGHQIELAFFGLDGRPVTLAEGVNKGFTRLTWEYDARGKLRWRGYYVLDDRGGCALLRRADAANRNLEEAFFTPEGRPTLNVEGIHRYRARYNERGHRTEATAFGLDGKPCLHKDGYHRFVRRYDERGRIVEEMFFGLDGKPCLSREGYHRGTSRYDERGNNVEWAHFGLDGKPCRRKTGIHRGTARYDERGNRVEEVYFGPDGKPTTRVDEGPHKGCAKMTYKYDAKGRLRQHSYWVPDGKGGYALRCRTDTANRTLEEAYFTPEGRPSLHKEGWHRWTARYDERGNRLEEIYFGLNGKPTPRVDGGSLHGCVRLTWEYDVRGQLRQRCYFVLDDKGDYALRRRADAADRTLEETFFTPEGRSTLNQDGYHRSSFRHDERGNCVEMAFFGLDGKPCLHREGYHRGTKHYDERGRLVSSAVYDRAGKRLPCRILVEKVTPGGLAARAGLREGDVLVRYADKELTTAALFSSLRSEEGASGPPRKLELLRQGKPLTVTLPPGVTGMTLINKAGPPAPRP